MANRRNSESRNSESIVRSSGNVFADIGLRDAGERQTKVRLAVAIQQIIQERRLSQAAAARLLDINQPKISALVNYHLDGFSVERLLAGGPLLTSVSDGMPHFSRSLKL